MRVPWGRKAFAGYLGPEEGAWRAYDASELVRTGARPELEILIDQGDDDQFLVEQLKPEIFAEACRQAGQPLKLRMQAGYDHSYYFIASFIEDHIRHHAGALSA
jgi:S-formylglutathione hydrolase